ncbi:MAG: TVP38/TMEM64 family protein [Nitrospira sp. CR1.3]|nr:TVP38/TMEM64 family protein [Nitrospira sp. CR1.3]
MTTTALTVSRAPRRMVAWIKLGLGILAAGAGWLALASVNYEQYLSPNAIARWLNEAGPLAPLLLIGSMVGAVIIPPIPSLPLDLAAGAAFGPFYGALYAVIGAEIGAILCFLIARSLGREALARIMTTENRFCQTCTDHQLMGAMFIARFIPIFSFDVVSYGAGLTNISLKTFALATLLGMAPPTFAFTYLGSSVVSAQWPLIAAGIAMVVFFLAMPKLLTKYRTSRPARWLMGPPPAPVMVPPAIAGITPQIRCVGCGAPVS